MRASSCSMARRSTALTSSSMRASSISKAAIANGRSSAGFSEVHSPRPANKSNRRSIMLPRMPRQYVREKAFDPAPVDCSDSMFR